MCINWYVTEDVLTKHYLKTIQLVGVEDSIYNSNNNCLNNLKCSLYIYNSKINKLQTLLMLLNILF